MRPIRSAAQIEAIQKRALNIIFTCTYGVPYSSALFLAGLTSLTARREQLARNFDSTVQLRSRLDHLLPPSRDPAILSRLRTPSKFLGILSRIKKVAVLHILHFQQVSDQPMLYLSFYCGNI